MVSGMDSKLDQFGTGEVVGSFPIMYFALFLFVGTFGLTDNALENLRKFLKIRRLEEKENAEFEKKALEARDPKNERRRQTAYVRKFKIIMIIPVIS